MIISISTQIARCEELDVSEIRIIYGINDRFHENDEIGSSRGCNFNCALLSEPDILPKIIVTTNSVQTNNDGFMIKYNRLNCLAASQPFMMSLNFKNEIDNNPDNTKTAPILVIER